MSAVPDMPDGPGGREAGHLPQEGMELDRLRTVPALTVSKEECVVSFCLETLANIQICLPV